MALTSGYQDTELGRIPVDWTVTSLETITDPKRPISYGIVQTGPIVPNGVRCLRVVDISEGRIRRTNLITTAKTISDAYKRTILKSGDIVVPLRGKVGDAALVDEELAGCNLTRGVALLAIRNGSSPSFCQQFISAPATRARLERAMNGSALQEIPIATLRSFRIALPPTTLEQELIARVLRDVDMLLDSLEGLLAKKRQLKRAAMQELLTGTGRLPGFNSVWETRRLEESFALVTTRNGELNDNVLTISAQQGFMRQEEFFNKRIASSVLENYYLVERGDFAYNRSYSKGYPFGAIKRLNTHEKGVVTTLYICFTLRPEADSDPTFFEHYFEAGLLNNGLAVVTNEGGRAHGLLNITKADFLSRELHCPPYSEQTAIAEVLSDMDSEIAALEVKLAKTRQLKQGMMQELLTGRVRLI